MFASHSKELKSGSETAATPKALILYFLDQLVQSNDIGAWSHFYNYSAKRGIFGLPRRWFVYEFIEVALEENEMVISFSSVAGGSLTPLLEKSGITVANHWKVEQRRAQIRVPKLETQQTSEFVDTCFKRLLKADPDYQVCGRLEGM